MNGRYHNYLATAKKIIDTYSGEEPFTFTLKKYFAGHKKHGSRDRKIIQALCYAYFRVAHALKSVPAEEKIVVARFLTYHEEDGLIQALRPDLSNKITLPPKEKFNIIGISIDELFPFINELSPSIDVGGFIASFLWQPKLFLRIRPQAKASVLKKLSVHIPNAEVDENCISLPNTFKAKDIFELDREVVVQDASSQKTLDDVQLLTPEKPQLAWDCCAASGGKSILLFDILKGNVQITATDIRQTILKNYSDRLAKAGIPVSQKLVADLSKGLPKAILQSYFDIIICDAPCTGSGTWTRTPEQLHFFAPAHIEKYASAQLQIAQTAILALKPGGLFFYITCSVFKRENEAIVEQLIENRGLKVLNIQYIQGAAINADSMFVAVLQSQI